MTLPRWSSPLALALALLPFAGCTQDPTPASDETETDTGEPSCLDTDAPGEDIVISFDSDIAELELGECVPNRIIITGGGVTDLSGLAHLREVGILEIRFNPLLDSLAGLEQLERIGTLIITNNAVLPELPAFPALADVNTIEITGNDALVDIGGFPALTSVGALEISSNGALTDYSGFEALASTSGDVELWDAPLITDLTGFTALTEIGGGLRIEDMGGLTSLAGMPVTSVGGDLRIVSNLALSECLVDDWAMAIDVGGATIASDNKPDAC